MARLLRMPEVAANVVQAVLSEWQVAENEPFSAQDTIATVETDKAVVDVPADADGVVLRFLAAAGTEVEVGAPIALIGDAGEQVDDLHTLLVKFGVAGDPGAADLAPAPLADPQPAAPAAATVGGASAVAPAVAGKTARVFSSPLARRLARDAGLDVEGVTGTGPGGRVVRRDVMAAVAGQPPSTPVVAVDFVAPSSVDRLVSMPEPTSATSEAYAEAPAFVDVPHSRMRRAIASRLTRSAAEAPHFAVRGSARVDALLAMRAELNATGGLKVSVTDLVIVAAARAYQRVPDLNVVWTPDAVRRFTRVDIAVAVATDRGLVTPVLRGLERLRLSQVAAASADLVSRAREGRLQQQELEGGALTVTNLGVYGTEDFTAIINPPQAAILAVGATMPQAVVVDGQLAVATVLRFTLSVDHRPVDGVTAARWVAALTSLLEHPAVLLA